MSVLDLVAPTDVDPTPSAMKDERFAARLVHPPEYKVLGSYTITDTAPPPPAAPGEPEPTPVTQLVVEDGSDFDDSGQGGWIRLRFSADGTGPDVFLEYSTWGGDETDVEYVELASPLAIAVPANTMVDVWDPATMTPDAYYEAIVVLDDADPDTRAFEVTVKQDVIDAIPEGLTLGRGQSVVLERRAGEDEIVLVWVEGELVRDGSKTPMVVAAEARTTGKMPGAFIAGDIDGARIEVDADADGGFIRILNTLGEIFGLWQIKVEDGVARLSFGTGGAGGIDPVRLRFRASEAERAIEALCTVLEVFGLIKGRGLQLFRSSTTLTGIDVFRNVQRTTSENGIVQLEHSLSAPGSRGRPLVVHTDPADANVPVVGPEDVDMVWDTSEAGGVVKFRVIWRSGPNANRPEGVAAGDRVVNRAVTFDWQIWAADR